MSRDIMVNHHVVKQEKADHFHNASYQYELLIKSIQAFQKELNSDEKVVLLLASFGQRIRLYVTDIGYADPSLIFFYGYIEGQNTIAQLIQHVTQLNFLITSAKRLNEDQPARRIGFN